uniref:B-cell receptor CD22-like isoform X2 n=1 Tax=Scatophagus argus TaxID=75038 RepID=UPI001ED81758|nr:B-cell receptor CD22-like isoform X2 [Scatophagus argus]
MLLPHLLSDGQPADTMRTTLLFLLLTCRLSSQSPGSEPCVCTSSLKVSPSRSQYFEYENVSLSCEHFDCGEWKVWRYTTPSVSSTEPSLSRCGDGWGSETSSTCEMKTIKRTDNGVYWCQSQSRDSSHAVNITVTGGPVILHSPALPVTEGHDVTLRCQARSHPSSLTFFKDGTRIRTEPTGHMTVHNFSKSDEGAYKCQAGGKEESPSSWLLMKDDSKPALLTASPNSIQLFEYDNVTLSCGHTSISQGWKVIRATRNSDGKLSLQSCGTKWGTPTPVGCILKIAKYPDSGVHWCETSARQRSNPININVADGPVILRSPVLPVTEGDDVTLECLAKKCPTSVPADFYKDGSLNRTELTRRMTIRRVSRSDAGLYRCSISTCGESKPSWLLVRDGCRKPPLPTASGLHMLRVIRYVVVASPYCVSTVLMLSLCCRRPTGGKPPVSMTMRPAKEDDERMGQMHDDVTDDVTTEHHF